MWTGKADLQKQRLIIHPIDRIVAIGGFVQLTQREVSDEHIGMQIFRKLPLIGSLMLLLVGPLPVERFFRAIDSMQIQGFVPLVIEDMRIAGPTAFGLPSLLVLHNETLMKAMILMVRIRMHLSDIHAVIAAVIQILHPSARLGIIVLQGSEIVREVTGEKAGPRGPAGWRGNVALGKGHALIR